MKRRLALNSSVDQFLKRANRSIVITRHRAALYLGVIIAAAYIAGCWTGTLSTPFRP